MKITIHSLYDYTDGAIFSSFVLPDGVDRDTVIYTILEEAGEFGSLYADPDFLARAIGIWSRKQLPIWKLLLETTQYEYDPISNYDRIEDSERHATGEATGKETSFDSMALQTTNGSDSKGDETYHSRVRGNIGITTVQKMIGEQRNVVRFNIVDEIAGSFRRKFCIEVYA